MVEVVEVVHHLLEVRAVQVEGVQVEVLAEPQEQILPVVEVEVLESAAVLTLLVTVALVWLSYATPASL